MLNIGWSEFFLVLIVALLIINPRDVPKIAYLLGKLFGKLQKALSFK